MSGYRRENLYDEEGGGEFSRMMLSSNITSIGNPTFASDSNLVASAEENANSLPTTGPTATLTLTPAAAAAAARNDENDNFRVSFVSHAPPPAFDRRSFGWSRMSQFEKLQSMVIVMLLMIICIMVFVMISDEHMDDIDSHSVFNGHHHHFVDFFNHNTSENLCLTDECITISSSIINALDRKVAPCTDFYKYACGGWIKNNPIPDGRSAWGTFSKLTQDNQLVLKNIIEDSKNNFSGAELKAKMYYDACMDYNGTIEKSKARPLKEFIDLVSMFAFGREIVDIDNLLSL